MRTKKQILAELANIYLEARSPTEFEKLGLAILAGFEKQIWNSAIDAVTEKLDMIEELSKLKSE